MLENLEGPDASIGRSGRAVNPAGADYCEAEPARCSSDYRESPRRTSVASRVARFIGLGLAGTFALLLTSCTGLFGNSPIQYVSVQIEIGNDGSCQQFVGMHYTVYNTTSKDISGLRVSFMMFDTSGNQVPQGQNLFDVTFTGTINANSEATICSSLDSKFYYLPTVSLVANQFHIYEVDFADGSSWTDWLGRFVYPYQVTSVQATTS